MGGWGSGLDYYDDAKPNESDFNKLDISSFTKKGIIPTDVTITGTSDWSTNGEKHSSISFEAYTGCNDPYIRLDYHSSYGIPYDYRIYLTTTTPYYGGQRWWFLCPKCNARVGVLFGDGLFMCRHCVNINYVCQQLQPMFRFKHLAYKELYALKGDYDLHSKYYPPPRPKGMHKKTYDKKIEKMLKYFDLSDRIAREKIGIELSSF